MTCDDYRRLIVGKRNLEATVAERRAAFGHWSTCSACKAWMVAAKAPPLTPAEREAVREEAALTYALNQADPETRM